PRDASIGAGTGSDARRPGRPPRRRLTSTPMGSVSRTSVTPAPVGAEWPRRHSCPTYRPAGGWLERATDFFPARGTIRAPTGLQDRSPDADTAQVPPKERGQIP